LGALAVLANLVRVLTLVLTGYYTQMQHYLVTVDHVMFGWVLLSIFMAVGIFVLQKLVFGPGVPPPARVAHSLSDRRLTPAIVALVVIAVGLGPALARFVEGRHVVDVEGFVATFRGGAPVAAERLGWLPTRGGDGVLAARELNMRAGPVVVSALTYSQQRPNSELIGFRQRLVRDNHWQSESIKSPLADQLPVGEAIFRHRSGTRLVGLFWYDSAGFFATNAMRAKTLQMAGALTRLRSDATLYMITTACSRSCSKASARLARLLAAHSQPETRAMKDLG